MIRSLALLALLLLPVVAAGNGPADASGFADATGFNTQRKMVREAEGALDYAYVVPAASGNGTDVVVVRVAPDGRETPLARPHAGLGDASRPTLALDGRGRLWAAWTERTQDDREVFVARWGGAAWVDATELSGGSGYAGFPSLATDGEGRLHVAWYGFDGTFYQTFYRRLEENGTWSPGEQLSSGNLDANNPSVVVDAQGGVHVAWYKSDGHRYRAWYAYRAPGEAAWQLPEAISQGDGEALNVALAVDEAGTVHATWDELHGTEYWILHATRGADGRWSAASALAKGGDAGEYPSIAAWGQGVLVAWSRKSDGAIVATDLAGAARPLLGGTVVGRDPSLRGATAFPASERNATLDILWTQPANGSYVVRRASVAPGCPPFDAPGSPCTPMPATPTMRAPGFEAAALLVAVVLLVRRRRP